MERAEQLRLYNFFAKVPESRKMAGVFYEVLAQQRFQEKIFLSIITMVKFDRREPTQKSKMPRWYTSHVLLTNPELEALRQNALRHVISINIVPSRTEELTDNGPCHIEQDVLYIPEATNHEYCMNPWTHSSGTVTTFTFSNSPSTKNTTALNLESFPFSTDFQTSRKYQTGDSYSSSSLI